MCSTYGTSRDPVCRQAICLTDVCTSGMHKDPGPWIKYALLASSSYRSSSVIAGLALRVSLLGSSSVLYRVVRPRVWIGYYGLQVPCPPQAWACAPQLVVLFWKVKELVGRKPSCGSWLWKANLGCYYSLLQTQAVSLNPGLLRCEDAPTAMNGAVPSPPSSTAHTQILSQDTPSLP